MRILVIDGQGGGMGRQLIEALKKARPEQGILCVGTNAAATAAMVKAGADAGATGENAVIVNCREADLILGPVGIVLTDALMGEITPAIAAAVGRSHAMKILLPAVNCRVKMAGMPSSLTLKQAIDSALKQTLEILDKN